MAKSRDDTKEEILSSSPYKKFKRIVKMMREQFDPVKIEEELRMIHAGRLVRNMKASGIDPKQMMEAVAREVGNRSRVVEIRVSLVDQKIELEKTLNAIQNYLLSEFEVEGLKYKNDKKAYFSRYVKPASDLLVSIEKLIDNCDTIVKDIDQAGFGTKLIKECLDMIYVKERSI